MDIIEVKVVSGLLFFLLVVVFGWLPFCLYHRVSASRHHGRYTMLRNVNNKITEKKGGNGLAQCLHYFASGVLIATCLLHLLPESLEAVEDGLKSMSRSSFHRTENDQFVDAINESIPVDLTTVEKTKDDENEPEFYPVAELLVALGFIFIYVFDSTIKFVQERNKMEKRQKKSKDCSLVDIILCNPRAAREDSQVSTYQNVSNGNIHLRDHSNKFFSKSMDTIQSTSPSLNHHKCESDMAGEETGIHMEEMEFKDEEHHHSSSTADQPHSTDVKSMALVMALCIHGFFDGVVLGLQTSVSVIYSLMFALSLHKLFVAISMSLTLAKNYIAICATNHHRTVSRYRYLLYVLLFAAVAPLGIIASAGFVNGSFATSQDDDSVSMVPGCLQSFAVGTFLYVTFTETTGHHGKLGTLCSEIQGHISLLVGFAMMASLRLAFGET